MRFYVSCTDGGSLKEVICDRNTDTSVQTAVQPVNIESSLPQSFSGRIQKIKIVSKELLLLCRGTGEVQLVGISRERKEVEKTETPVQVSEKKGNEDTSQVESPSPEISRFEILDSVSGLLDDSKLEPLYKNSKKRSKLEDCFVSAAKLNSNNDYMLATSSGFIHIINLNLRKKKLSIVNSFEVKAPLEFAQFYDLDSESKTYTIAYGGEENLIKIVQIDSKLEKLTQVWEAKNCKNDKLDMRVPVWPSALKFLQPLENDKLDETKLNYQFMTVSRYSHVTEYQTQHGRKPLRNNQFHDDKEPLTQLELLGAETTPEGNIKLSDFSKINFITTDTKKDVIKYDLKARVLKKYGKSDIVGSPTFISVHKQRFLLEGGLDKYLRVYDLKSNTRIAKVYVNSKINYICMIDEENCDPKVDESKNSKRANKRKATEEVVEEDEDPDQVWEKLDEISHKKTKK